MARDPNVEILQDIIIRNLDTLGINMQADQIGNYTTGEPDGILGSGTALALNTLVNQGQMASPDLENGEAFTNSYNADTIGYIADYMALRGVSQEDIDSFVETATASLVETDLGAQYEGTEINTDRTADSLNAARATFEITRQATLDGADPAQAVQDAMAAQEEARAAEATEAELSTLMEPNADYTQADGTVYSNGRVAAMQGVIINNLDKLDIGLTAQQIGGADGQPDDLMGGNTAAALQTIVYSAQLSSGVDASDVTLDITGQTHSMVSAYLLNNGVSEEDTMVFMGQLADLNGDLNGAYTQGADVDPSTLDIEVIAETEAPSADDEGVTAQADELDGAEGLAEPGTDITTEPGMFTPTTTMTLEEFEELGEEDVLSLEQQYMVENFPAARDAALEEAGMGDVQARLDEAVRFEAEEVDGLIQSAATEKNGIDRMLREERARFADTPITFEYEHDGETHTTRMSLNEINEKDGSGFLFFGDGDTDREQAAYDAGRVAFQEQLLQQIPEGQDPDGEQLDFAALQARSAELRDMIPRTEVRGPYDVVEFPGSIQADADQAISDLQAEKEQIIAQVDASEIVVATGEAVPIETISPELAEVAEDIDAVAADVEENGSALDEAAALMAEIEAGLDAVEAGTAELEADQEERAASLAELSDAIDAELSDDASHITSFADELDGASELAHAAIVAGYDHEAGIGGEFETAITRTEMPDAPVSYIPESGMVTPTATMTQAEFLALQDEDVLDVEQQYMVASYSDAREITLQQAGLEEAEARLAEAERFRAEDVDGLIADARTEKSGIDTTLRAEREQFADTPIVFDYEYEGETITTRMSLNEINEKDGGHFLFWDGDSAQEQAAYDAGRIAFEEQLLQQVPEGQDQTYGDLQARSRELHGMVPRVELQGPYNSTNIPGSIQADADRAIAEAEAARDAIVARVDNAEIHVATGEEVPVDQVEDLEAVRPVGFAEGISDVETQPVEPVAPEVLAANEQGTDVQVAPYGMGHPM